MTNNISGFGFRVNVVATNTFPVGVIIDQWADDADPFDLPSLQIGDTAMGLNGDLISWAKANPIKVTLNVIPGSNSDINLGILFESNRVARGKTGARDIITLTGIYPDGRFVTLTQGVITDGIPANSIASAGREKSKSYAFAFENKIAV